MSISVKENSQPESRSISRWIVSLFCLVALSMSVWLTVMKLTGKIDSLVGCGAGSGCANLLGSKWSVVLKDIPVSVLSGLLYLGILCSFLIGHGFARWFRICAAFLILGAAGWFTFVQLVVVKTICPYCVTVHLIGVLIAVWILILEYRVNRKLVPFIVNGVLACVGMTALAVVQYRSEVPDTHRIDQATVFTGSDSGEGVFDPHLRGEGRTVEFFDGGKAYRVSGLPHMGEADAEYVIVKYFDYTCQACRGVHASIAEIQDKHPGKLAVIVLPTPLERACNPHLPVGLKDQAKACAFARLAIRVWLADRTKFSEFHDWLFEYHEQPIEIAEAMAYGLVDEGEMNQVSAEDINALLEANVHDYKKLVSTTPVLPKILLGGSNIMHGVARDTETLEKVLQERLGFGKK